MKILWALVLFGTMLLPQQAGSGTIPYVPFKEYPNYIVEKAPAQIIEFGKRHPEFIKKLKKNGSKYPLPYDEIKDTMISVNTEGNKIKWTTDQAVWGSGDVWEFPCATSDGVLHEDCDGIALWKYKKLIDYGIPPTSIIFTVLFTETGEGHAVLVIVTDKGEYVLDNRRPNIVTVQEDIKAGYQFVWRPKSGNDITGQWIEYPYKAPKVKNNGSMINNFTMPSPPLCILPKKSK